ncbi:Invasion protein InvF [compost metagenome]
MVSQPLLSLELNEYLAEGVWHVTVGRHPLRWQQGGTQSSVAPGWQGLLAITAHSRFNGLPADLRVVRCQSLTRLQVFIDQGEVAQHQPVTSSAAACLPLAFDVIRDTQLLESWYIQQALAASLGFERFATALRNSEEYWLVRYLLEQGTGQDSLQMLARRYGVSVSHFRRLCHQALGGATKPALRGWRVARALLESIREGRSLTEVAQNQGYCSSSHFSREVRELLGVAPSQLGDIIGTLRP